MQRSSSPPAVGANETVPRSRSTTASSSGSEPKPSLLLNLFNSLRHNQASAVDDLVHALRHSSPQETTEQIRRNFQFLQEQGLMSEKSLDEAELQDLLSGTFNHQPEAEPELLEYTDSPPLALSRFLASPVEPVQKSITSSIQASQLGAAFRCEDHLAINEFLPCSLCAALLHVMNSFTTPVLEKLAQSPLSSTLDEDEHIVITGNTRSWNAARKLPGFDHGWEQYAIVDEQIKNMMRPIDRLSIYNARRWLKYVSAAFAERDLSLLPLQLHPTAAQYEHKKDGIVNIVPFPNIRTRIILNPDKFLHDDFWALATTEVRFLWESSVEDGYTQNARTGLFEFTPEFHKCLNDPNCWAMTSDFFDAFPEFHGEAKVFEPPVVAFVKP